MNINIFLGVRDILGLINDMGFDASVFNREITSTANYLSHQEEIKKWKRSFFVSFFFGFPCMIIMMYYMVEMSKTNHLHKNNCCVYPGLSLQNLLLFILSTPVQVITGKKKTL